MLRLLYLPNHHFESYGRYIQILQNDCEVVYNSFVLEIISAPNPVLSDIAKPVSKINDSIRELVEEMKMILAHTTDPKGVGLAAPQIGRSLRIFIAKPTDKSAVLVFINPKIVQQSSQLDYIKRPAPRSLGEVGPKKDTSKKASKKLEGCLSLPTIWGPVLRASSLTLSYFDEYGKPHKQKFSKFLATVVQHEMDHLDGILFPKRVLEQKGILYKSSKNEKDEDVFEEIEI